MGFGHIYLITNAVNEKKYVGQTTMSPARRWTIHKCVGKNKPKTAIGHAINKYGAENFTFEVVHTAESRDELNRLEKMCILYANSTKRGYNLTTGGDGLYEMTPDVKDRMSMAQTGRKHTEETKRKIGEKSKGRPITEAQKAAISKAQTGSVRSEEFKTERSRIMTENNPFKGKTHTDETRQRMRDAKKGYTPRPRTPEELEKIRIANTGKVHSEETKAKMRSYWANPENLKRASEVKAAYWAAKRAAKAA